MRDRKAMDMSGFGYDDPWDAEAGNHPAHDLAGRVRGSAEELRTYLDPGNDFPRRLAREDHIELLLQMQMTIEELAAGISSIYQQTTDARASGKLGTAVDGLIHVIEDLEASRAPLYAAGHAPAEPESPARPAAAPSGGQDTPQALAAEGFPREHAGGQRPGSVIEGSSGQPVNSAAAARTASATPQARPRGLR